MPLDICYRVEGKDNTVEFQLEDGAHYWYLHPWFARIHKSIGKYIDLYGSAVMDSSSGLPILAAALREARAHAKRQPKEWKVHVGTQLRPTRMEIYETVKRDDLLRTIHRLQRVVERAEQEGITVVFAGD